MADLPRVRALRPLKEQDIDTSKPPRGAETSRRAAAFYTLSRAASPWARHSARNSRADAVRNLSRWCTRRNLRERSSPSTRNTATCPFSSASAAMRRGSTATPRPRVAAFTSASVLVDSHTGATVKPAAAAALSNCSRVPLPFRAAESAGRGRRPAARSGPA